MCGVSAPPAGRGPRRTRRGRRRSRHRCCPRRRPGRPGPHRAGRCGSARHAAARRRRCRARASPAGAASGCSRWRRRRSARSAGGRRWPAAPSPRPGPRRARSAPPLCRWRRPARGTRRTAPGSARRRRGPPSGRTPGGSRGPGARTGVWSCAAAACRSGRARRRPPRPTVRRPGCVHPGAAATPRRRVRRGRHRRRWRPARPCSVWGWRRMRRYRRMPRCRSWLLPCLRGEGHYRKVARFRPGTLRRCDRIRSTDVPSDILPTGGTRCRRSG